MLTKTILLKTIHSAKMTMNDGSSCPEDQSPGDKCPTYNHNSLITPQGQTGFLSPKTYLCFVGCCSPNNIWESHGIQWNVDLICPRDR